MSGTRTSGEIHFARKLTCRSSGLRALSTYREAMIAMVTMTESGGTGSSGSIVTA